MTAAVVVGRDVVWRRGFGWADVANATPADAETIYRIGSISKSFTAILVAQLTERGVLDLDDPVVRHLPEFARLAGPPEQVAAITLRQLASHTGGLSREPGLEDAASGPLAQWEEKLVASIPTAKLESAPGEKYYYSNIGYGLLGLAAARAAGRPFMELVHEFIIEPLGMHRTGFVVSPEVRVHLAVGYDARRGTITTERPALEHDGRGYKVPNGGLYSTVDDLARFIAALTSAAPVSILAPATSMAILTVQTLGDNASGYGLGFQMETGEDGVRLVGHGGSVSGYNANVVFDPTTGIGVILLRNYDRGRTNLGQAAKELLRELVAARSRS